MSTAVFFHAHPDDESLLTGGTMALLARAGHRVVLVTATAGEAGLSGQEPGTALGRRRRAELDRAADLLGCARVEVLGYPDSGSAGPPPADCFARVPVDAAAGRLAEILRAERAELLTGYDPAGGYGHRDHVQVHRVARAAAALAGTPLLLEATVDRRALQRALRLVTPLTRGAPDFRPERFAERYGDPESITHRVPVGAVAAAKRAAMRAHLSQASGGDTPRSLERFSRLPAPLFRAVFGREWYAQPGAPRPARPLSDPLRSAAGPRSQ